jgi:hypothetical protein
MWWIVFPILGVVGLIVLVMTLISAIAGVVIAWPWLLVALGVWLLIKDSRYGKHAREPHAWHPHVHDREEHQRRPDARETVAPTRKPVRLKTVPPRRPGLPIDLQVKVDQITSKADALLRYADRFPPFSRDLFLVRQTTAEYLPRTIEAFLALPPEAAQRVVTATGRTPHQELKAQLELLDAKLDEVAEDLQREDVDRLLANRRFLELRFGGFEGEPHNAKSFPKAEAG